MENKTVFIAAGAAVLLMGASAAVASYYTRESVAPTQQTAIAPQPAQVTSQSGTGPAPVHRRHVASARPAQPACDDNNIVGTLAGGVGGGVVGSQFGKGHGNTAATIGGTLGGAYLGNQVIPTRNVTCR